MSDLRTRIAAAIYKGCDNRVSPGLSRQAADAVIRELDPAIPCAASGCRMRQITRQHADKTCGLTDSTDAK